MDKINFESLPSTNTPINDDNLNLMQENIEKFIQLMHPIGSIYMSTISTNPAEIFGFGTWEAWGSGRVPVGVDTAQIEFATVEKTGGEKTHKLIVDEMPSHNHAIDYAGDELGVTANIPGGSGTAIANHTGFIKNTGGDQPHNNLQPYITCYMWKRTA